MPICKVPKVFLILEVCCGIILAGCHSPTPKQELKTIQKKDSIKPVVQKMDTVKPIAQEGDSDTDGPIYVMIDTIVNHDTINVTLYNDTMISCSINRLADTLNGAHIIRGSWDESFANYRAIYTPNRFSPVNFILNDTMFLFTIGYGYTDWDCGISLFLLHRTKKSLKFVKRDKDNPISRETDDLYIDLKKNEILEDFNHEISDYEDAGEFDGEYGRYIVERYKIQNGKFVQTDYVALSFPEFRYFYFGDGNDTTYWTFYHTISMRENWARDRYDSSNVQRAVILDTTIGKDKVNISYTNKGNIIASFNGDADTLTWQDTWLGYEVWRGADCNRIIVPGKKNPVSFVMKDSVILFNITDRNRNANLFLVRRSGSSFDISSKIIRTESHYLYADLTKNTIIEESGYFAKDGKYPMRGDDTIYNEPPLLAKRYRILHNELTYTNIDTVYFKEFNGIQEPYSYPGMKQIYTTIAKREDWSQRRTRVKK